MGKNKFLYSKDVKWVKVPHIKSLSIQDILNFAKEYTDIESYLPNYNYDKFPNRDWLCNVINTISNKEFSSFISGAMEKRDKLIIMNRGLKVEAIPEIVSVFSRSKNVSVMNGRTHFLMRKEKHRSKKSYQDRVMNDAEETKENISNLTDKIKNLEEKINAHQNSEDLLLQDKEKLCKLYKLRVIDSDEEYIEDK